MILNRKILNLTEFFHQRHCEADRKLLDTLLIHAGKDISHYFDATGQPLRQISFSGKQMLILAAAMIESPMPNDSTSEAERAASAQTVAANTNYFWWNNPKYEIGMVTSYERRIRIINTLTHRKITLPVCDEDSLEIVERKYNGLIGGSEQRYVWCKNYGDSKGLDMRKTLVQNGFVFDGTKYGIHPAIWLYFISDFGLNGQIKWLAP